MNDKQMLMTQILVTLEDNSIAPQIVKAIEMLKGVVHISLYDKEEKEIVSNSSATVRSPRIQRLRGVAKDITKQQVKEDERLAYLLNK